MDILPLRPFRRLRGQGALDERAHDGGVFRTTDRIPKRLQERPLRLDVVERFRRPVPFEDQAVVVQTDARHGHALKQFLEPVGRLLEQKTRGLGFLDGDLHALLLESDLQGLLGIRGVRPFLLGTRRGAGASGERALAATPSLLDVSADAPRERLQGVNLIGRELARDQIHHAKDAGGRPRRLRQGDARQKADERFSQDSGMGGETRIRQCVGDNQGGGVRESQVTEERLPQRLARGRGEPVRDPDPGVARETDERNGRAAKSGRETRVIGERGIRGRVEKRPVRGRRGQVIARAGRFQFEGGFFHHARPPAMRLCPSRGTVSKHGEGCGLRRPDGIGKTARRAKD